jgi:hypothetical protein
MKEHGKFRIVGWVVGLTACVMAVSMTPALAYKAEITPSDECYAGSSASLAALEHDMAPASGATVHMGETVVFSGESGAPLTFAVASSPALLETAPDIDSGPGSVSAGASSTTPSKYEFRSIHAASTVRTVYWRISFVDTGLHDCMGQSPTTYSTTVHTLTVLPSVVQSEGESTEARESREAAERKAREEAQASHCVVPSLTKDTLSKARRALGKAHCRLGTVTRPRKRVRGALVVRRQSPRSGTQLAGGARVSVTLGVETPRRHRQ